MNKNYTIAIKLFLFFFLLTGIAYPLLITFISQVTMPHLANGSLIQKNGKWIGSQLISQASFENKYFWPRPSAIDYNPSLASGGTNVGPTSSNWPKMIQKRKKKYGENAPIDLIFASASGLDPHISLEAAYYQIPRISQARSLQEDVIKKLISKYAEGRQFGFLGPNYINVLILNLALDKIDGTRKSN